MKLDETQTARVRQWIDQGLKVADIQNRLADELGVKLTYMEARFLLDDLRLKPKDPPPAPKPTGAVLAPSAGAPAAPAPAPGQGLPGGGAVPGGPGGVAGPGGPLKAVPMGDEPAGGGRVTVTVDEIARPKMMVSGKVTFSDGQPAEWGIDQMGRPMLMPKQQGYRPSQADIMDFQAELEQVLGRLGF